MFAKFRRKQEGPVHAYSSWSVQQLKSKCMDIGFYQDVNLHPDPAAALAALDAWAAWAALCPELATGPEHSFSIV